MVGPLGSLAKGTSEVGPDLPGAVFRSLVDTPVDVKRLASAVTLGATPATDPNRQESGHGHAQPVTTAGADAGHRPALTAPGPAAGPAWAPS